MTKKATTPKSRIHLLAPEVSAKIAAGEVLERPASAVRELLDNSLDAGASRIKIEIREGGKKLIRIEDDGCGMSLDELALCVQKHATSKIESAEDIFAVASLGFRGEALYATAAVSRLRIVSNPGNGANELCVEAGKQLHLREAAGAKGTLVEISKLFFNTPARKEFLRSDVAEMRAIKKIVTERMLAFPGVDFSFVVDGKSVYDSRAGSLRDRVGDLFGSDNLQYMIEVENENEQLSIKGLISAVHFNSSSRKDQFFILNSRPVFTPSLSHALQGAYDNMLSGGRYPYAFLHISIDPAAVNVNIHPDKREVRFRDEQAVYAIVRSSVRKALQEKRVFAAPLHAEPTAPSSYKIPAGVRPAPSVQPASKQPSLFAGKALEQSDVLNDPPADWQSVPVAAVATGVLQGVFAGYVVSGTLLANYWLLEKDEVVLMVDQHAAHERVLYEKFKKEYFSEGVATQGLLVPAQLFLSPEEESLLEKHAETVQKMGFSVEKFGPELYAIQEVPQNLRGAEVDALKHLLSVLDGSSKRASNEKTERMLTTLACRSAVKQGDKIIERELIDILNQLANLEHPFSCPHGRPAIIELRKESIEKWFQRR